MSNQSEKLDEIMNNIIKDYTKEQKILNIF